MTKTVALLSKHWMRMKSHVVSNLPNEACGLVAGKTNKSIEIFPIENILHHPARFQMEPRSLISALHKIEAHGWNLQAIYHSHPTGPSTPSAIDIAEVEYPESAQLIWSQSRTEWVCRGFIIQAGKVSEIEINIM